MREILSRCSHTDVISWAKPQVRGLVDLGCHYASTPTFLATPIQLTPPNMVLRRGGGDR
jgi:hypothetical protein